MSRTRCLLALALLAPLAAAVPHVAASPADVHALRPPVTVGTLGNEPLVRAAPDGTLYVSALQHLYVSTDDGRSWTMSKGSAYSETANLASDSSIALDPTGRLYQSFDFPYAGSTAVCTSDDRAVTFSCNPVVLPGGTDRMWLAVKDRATSYVVTNEGLYQSVFATSTDRGATYLPGQTAGSVAEPTDGPLLVSPRTGKVVQPIIDNLTNQTATTNFESGTGLLRVYTPGVASPAAVETHPIPLTAGGALPGAAYGKDGTLWVTSEKAVRSGGRITSVRVTVARSKDDGATWTVLPPVTTTGTSTFVALGAGRAGHVGLVFYRTRSVGDPGAVAAGTVWDAVYAESTDALSTRPHWALSTVDPAVHKGVICATAGCMGAGRFAGDFLDTSFDARDRPVLVWQSDRTGTPRVRFTGARG